MSEDDPERPWDERGVYRVAAGLYRLPLPMPSDGLRAVNAYALTADGAVSLVDPGVSVEDSREVLLAGLGALGAGPEDVTNVLATHVHYDHYSEAVAFRRRHGTPVWLGRHEQPSVEALRTAQLAFEPQLDLLRRYGATDLADELGNETPVREVQALLSEDPDRWIASHELIDVAGTTLRALHTPGHTRGHVVFRDEERGLLFAGDHVLPTITPSIGFEAATADRPLGDYLRSLLAVRSLPDTVLLPAHGRITDSVHSRVDELVDHHDRRLGAARAAVTAGASTALEVAQRLPWTRRDRRYTDLDPYNRMLAVLETGFHLDLLVERGELTGACEGVTRHYAPA